MILCYSKMMAELFSINFCAVCDVFYIVIPIKFLCLFPDKRRAIIYLFYIHHSLLVAHF